MIPQEFIDWFNNTESPVFIDSYKRMLMASFYNDYGDTDIEIGYDTADKFKELLCGYIIKFLAEKANAIGNYDFINNLIWDNDRDEFCDIVFSYLEKYAENPEKMLHYLKAGNY